MPIPASLRCLSGNLNGGYKSAWQLAIRRPQAPARPLAILRTLIRQRCPQLRRRQCRTLACELNRITGTFGHEPSMPQAGDLSTLVKLKLRHYPVVECFPFLYSYSTSTNGNTCDLLKTFPSANQRPPLVGISTPKSLPDSRGLLKRQCRRHPSIPPQWQVARDEWPLAQRVFPHRTEHEIIGSSSISP